MDNIGDKTSEKNCKENYVRNEEKDIGVYGKSP